MRNGLSIFLFFLSAAFAGQPAPLVFTHVTIIDATGQPALPDRSVVVVGDRIQAVGITGKFRAPRHAKIVNAAGKFMIPGLWDMHVHLRGGQDLITDNESSLTMFVANGIVGVRDMGGDLASTVFKWRRQSLSIKMTGILRDATDAMISSRRYYQLMVLNSVGKGRPLPDINKVSW